MEVDGKIIGHVMFSKAELVLDDGSKKASWTFGPISIHPAYKRKGYGLKLLQYALDKARDMGISFICMEGNIEFYKHAGFDLASKLLFKFCGKPKAVEKYMRKLGFHDIHIRMTEEQIHKNPAKAIENSSTPAEMVRLFEWFYHHKDDNRYLTFIWKAMADCSTGLKRIPAAISADARIVHKTGTGFPSAEGLQDMNDAGIILMLDGSHAIIAVFTTNSSSEAVIANITRQLLDTIIK